MKKISDCQTLSYSKTVPVEFEKKIFLVSRLDLFVLRVQSWRNGQRSNLFTFKKRLRILKKVENFSRKIDIF